MAHSSELKFHSVIGENRCYRKKNISFNYRDPLKHPIFWLAVRGVSTDLSNGVRALCSARRPRVILAVFSRIYSSPSRCGCGFRRSQRSARSSFRSTGTWSALWKWDEISNNLHGSVKNLFPRGKNILNSQGGGRARLGPLWAAGSIGNGLGGTPGSLGARGAPPRSA